MSVVKIRTALEVALAGMTPAVSISYENAAFAPVAGVPYQMAFLLLATPANPTMGDAFHREQGIFQITLMYPIQAGTAAAAARAVLIQAQFARGSTFTSGGVTVRVMATPEISAASVDGDRWAQPVKVRWTADIFS